jgi:hypothetical protein
VLTLTIFCEWSFDLLFPPRLHSQRFCSLLLRAPGVMQPALSTYEYFGQTLVDFERLHPLDVVPLAHMRRRYVRMHGEEEARLQTVHEVQNGVLYLLGEQLCQTKPNTIVRTAWRLAACEEHPNELVPTERVIVKESKRGYSRDEDPHGELRALLEVRGVKGFAQVRRGSESGCCARKSISLVDPGGVLPCHVEKPVSHTTVVVASRWALVRSS